MMYSGSHKQQSERILQHFLLKTSRYLFYKLLSPEFRAKTHRMHVMHQLGATGSTWFLLIWSLFSQLELNRCRIVGRP